MKPDLQVALVSVIFVLILINVFVIGPRMSQKHTYRQE
jgi:hypothetical protein